MIGQLDLRLLLLIHGQPPALLPWMRLLTYSGSYGGVFLLAGVLLLALGRGPGRALGLQLLAALGMVFLLVTLILKPLIARPRPYTVLGRAFLLGPLPHGLSFPSGHAAVAFAGAAIVGRFHRRYRPLLFLYAVLIGWSRLYLGTHWPSDVLAGAVIGCLAGMLVPRILPTPRLEVPTHDRTTRRSARHRKVYPDTGHDEP